MLFQVRQLEFIIADAIAKGHKHIITAGAVHSNHCRAVAASCAELGLQSHLFLRTPAKVCAFGLYTFVIHIHSYDFD